MSLSEGIVHQRHHRGGQQRPRDCAWVGEVTWRVTAELRESLFDLLDCRDSTVVRLDVRKVTDIDRTGVALLIGASVRSAAVGCRLMLIDKNGPVTCALSRRGLLRHFVVVEPTGRQIAMAAAVSDPSFARGGSSGVPWSVRGDQVVEVTR